MAKANAIDLMKLSPLLGGVMGKSSTKRLFQSLAADIERCCAEPGCDLDRMFAKLDVATAVSVPENGKLAGTAVNTASHSSYPLR
jgi:hypothetical protein